MAEGQNRLGGWSYEEGKKISVRAHFVNRVFEKIFSMGTSYFLHHAAVILSECEESERG